MGAIREKMDERNAKLKAKNREMGKLAEDVSGTEAEEAQEKVEKIRAKRRIYVRKRKAEFLPIRKKKDKRNAKIRTKNRKMREKLPKKEVGQRRKKHGKRWRKCEPGVGSSTEKGRTRDKSPSKTRGVRSVPEMRPPS